MAGVVIEVPAKGAGAVPIWVDLEHPRLRPAAVILAHCDRARVLIRAAQTRRQVIAELPESQRQRVEDQATMFGLDLDAHDERIVEALTRYHLDARELPVAYLNRLVDFAVPPGYLPVLPEHQDTPATGRPRRAWSPIEYTEPANPAGSPHTMRTMARSSGPTTSDRCHRCTRIRTRTPSRSNHHSEQHRRGAGVGEGLSRPVRFLELSGPY